MLINQVLSAAFASSMPLLYAVLTTQQPPQSDT